MSELYRLLRLTGMPWWCAGPFAFASVLFGLGPWARYRLMMARLGVDPADES